MILDSEKCDLVFGSNCLDWALTRVFLRLQLDYWIEVMYFGKMRMSWQQYNLDEA